MHQQFHNFIILCFCSCLVFLFQKFGHKHIHSAMLRHFSTFSNEKSFCWKSPVKNNCVEIFFGFNLLKTQKNIQLCITSSRMDFCRLFLLRMKHVLPASQFNEYLCFSFIFFKTQDNMSTVFHCENPQGVSLL